MIWLVGAGTVLLGVTLRTWAQQHLRHRLQAPLRLTTTGPFQFVRNPLYLGNLLLCVGATITSQVLWLVPVTLFWCLGIFSLVVRYEEAHLRQHYGEPYRRYFAEVPRWFPRSFRLRNLGLVNESFRRAVRAELPCLLILFSYILKALAARWFQP